MKRNLLIFCALAVGVVLGAFSTYLLTRPPENTDRWIPVVSDGPGIGFNDKVISVDFSLPDSKKPTGKIKFLNRDKGIQLGYMLTLPIDPKPTKDLPAKYSKPTKTASGWELEPPDQLEYEGSFSFTLKDADGFVLAQLTGPQHYITAGSQNQVQGTVDEIIPPSIVKRTRIVVVDFTVIDCVPCDPQ